MTKIYEISSTLPKTVYILIEIFQSFQKFPLFQIVRYQQGCFWALKFSCFFQKSDTLENHFLGCDLTHEKWTHLRVDTALQTHVG